MKKNAIILTVLFAIGSAMADSTNSGRYSTKLSKDERYQQAIASVALTTTGGALVKLKEVSPLFVLVGFSLGATAESISLGVTSNSNTFAVSANMLLDSLNFLGDLKGKIQTQSARSGNHEVASVSSQVFSAWAQGREGSADQLKAEFSSNADRAFDLLADLTSRVLTSEGIALNEAIDQTTIVAMIEEISAPLSNDEKTQLGNFVTELGLL